MAAPAPMIIGHRGAPGYRPEHTRAAFELAVAQGVGAVEVDVVPSRDGELVVRHDAGLAGTTDVAARPEFAGRRRTRLLDGKRVHDWFTDDFTWAELAVLRARERLPRLRPGSAAHDGDEGLLRLADVLDIARTGGVSTIVELKHATDFAARGLPLDELLVAQVPVADRGRIVVESFQRAALDALAARGWDAPLVYLMKVWGTAPGARRGYWEERRDPARAARS